MIFDIRLDDLSDGKVIGLLYNHLTEMHKYSPPESIHALDENKLMDPAITFWSARSGDELLGCGALKEISPGEGEIKSMKTALAHTRKGVGARILEAILSEAARRNYQRVSLETGTNPAFDPAVALYTKNGFIECGPFGEYQLDPYSRFYTLTFD